MAEPCSSDCVRYAHWTLKKLQRLDMQHVSAVQCFTLKELRAFLQQVASDCEPSVHFLG
jgi:hypothetical protein